MADPGSERVRLRHLSTSPADIDLLTELDSDPEVMRYLTGGPATPRAFIETSIAPRIEAAAALPPPFGIWAAHDRATDTFLGWFSLSPDRDDPATASLGYRLRRDAWGHGYATEVSRALIDRAFATTPLQRVTAQTYEANERSRRVMTRLGMRHSRTFRFTTDDLAAEGSFDPTGAALLPGDDVEYEVAREEWARPG